MKKVNCLTRALWFWERYGGEILYDEHHATVKGGEREYYDPYPTKNMIPLETLDFDRIRKNHAEFLNDHEEGLLVNYYLINA